MKSVSSMRFCGPSSRTLPAESVERREFGVLAYEVQFDHRPSIRLGGQHSGYRWMNEAELRATADVHENTKHHFAENC